MAQIAPLRVAVIVKATASYQARATRNMGIWSYEVEDFSWAFFAPGKGTVIDVADYRRRGFDLIWLEDGGVWSEFTNRSLPVVYHSIDSTLSYDHHYLPRLEQAKKSDLVLVDHDDLGRFTASGKPVYRLSHCVNDRLFKPAEEKTLDVCFHCGSSPERHAMRVRLSRLCSANGMSYVSGAVSLEDYARDMGRAKVVVNVPRTALNRPHRLLDGMASGAAVVTLPVPDVSDEPRRAGLHYMEVADESLLEERVVTLVKHNTWELLGIGGRELVQKYHSWAVRAKQLRELIRCALSV